jgi:DNA-binding CsgD family transcriptional regulator
MSRTGLRGRESECALLDDLLARIRRSESQSLVLRGEAGIGKTALLDYLVASTSDLAVIRAVGVESEMELAYASLHQLCVPLLDRRDALPAPQRQAMETAFGMSAGGAPDRFLVGLAVLGLFAAAAEQRPLLCVLDDAQWLDRTSAVTLAFVARRLLAEAVGIVFAAREPDDELRDLPELEVRGVRNGDARALLSSAVPYKLDERVRDRIVAETRGNPLALLELPRGLTATQLAGGFGVVEAQALTVRIEESFVRRLEELSDDARRLSLVAAAEPVGDPLLLWRASERLGIQPAASAAAEEAGLLAIGERVTFRHPLVRSAVYRSAAVPERRAVHLALADATDREADPDRRAWHLAAAAAAPDEGVAMELERSAGRAQARGGLAAAAAFLKRAVELTADPARRVERALAAAEASLHAGAFDAALGLIATAEAGPLGDFQRARVDLLRGHVAFASDFGTDAPALLLRAAKRLEPFDLQLARETYLIAWGAATIAGPLAGREVRLEICRAVRTLPEPGEDSRALALLLDGLAVLTTEGHAAAMPTLQLAAEALADIPVEDVLRWGFMGTDASWAAWDIEAIRAISERQVELVRDAGAFAQLPFHLWQLGISTAWMGELADAASVAAESESLASATRSPIAPYTALRLAGLRGSEGEYSAMIGAFEQAAAGGQGIAIAHVHWTAAVLFNALGRYDEAMAAARQAVDEFPDFWKMHALPELVEAAARAGDADLARDAHARLSAMTDHCGNDFAHGMELRCRALLSSGATGDGLYRDAIEQLSRTRIRPELARAHLLYGEWLRREGRRVDARAQLRTAYGMFGGIGMEAFEERARVELQATGEKVRKRTAEIRDALTAQERQIALLARDGLSNPEIGSRLFLSPRTVEWHLRKVFAKLEIQSRRQLAHALADSDTRTAAA